MQLATGGDMLNFGYWDGKASDPVSAQSELCSLVGEMAELGSAKKLVDIGSGLGAPAAQWKSAYGSLDISCVNINFQQLLAAKAEEVSLLNATSTMLPLSDGSADRIIALESAQHFRPLKKFIKESKRVLGPGGLLVVAIPVMARALQFFKLGILSWTWSSEHYALEYVKSAIEDNGFDVQDVRRIGHEVYEPLTDYYVLNRGTLRERILEKYPPFLENILYRSLLKMRDVSKKGIIDYVVIKAQT